MILSPQGQLIWFSPAPREHYANDLELQRYEDQSVLTYWQGGQRVAANWRGRDPQPPLSDGRRCARWERLCDRFPRVHDHPAWDGADQRLQGHPGEPDLGRRPRHGQLIDSAIQEINIATGGVVWQWRASRHVPVSDSYAVKRGNGRYDFFHLNSIEQLPNGNLLVSARHTWTVYEINKHTGAIVWQLGGKHSSFKFGPGAQFEWQHDARINRTARSRCSTTAPALDRSMSPSPARCGCA